MESFIDLIFIGLMFWLGWTLRGLLIIRAMSENPEKIIEILKEVKRINQAERAQDSQEQPETTTQLKIERHGDMLYAFSQDRDEFIAQGTNLTEVLDRAHQRFPNKVFVGTITNDNPAKELA